MLLRAIGNRGVSQARFIGMAAKPFANNELPVLDLAANTRDDRFKQNYEDNKKIADEYLTILRKNLQGGNEKQRQRHFSRNKMLPRDRITRLLDPGSPFLELNQIGAHQVYKEEVHSAGIVTGIGKIHDKLTMIIANDATVRAGTYYPLTIKKHVRAQEIALENNIPCVYLVDSGGINLNMHQEVFADKGHFGSIFYNMATMSALNIPQVSVAFGGCTAGGAYQISMVDENVIVDKNGFSFLGGPPLVKAATGEIISAEELGGARLHSEKSGVTDHFAVDEKHAIQIVRDIMFNTNAESFFDQNTENSIAPEPPLYPADDLYGVISPDFKIPMSMMQLIAHVFDGSKFHQFKKLYGTTLKCGYARLYGHLVGILANDGVLYPESSLKGAHFVEMCSQRGIPIIFLHNITGFMIGSKVEVEGINKHGAKLIGAVSNCRSPKISLVIGASFGAGNYGMCGRAFGPRFMWSIPSATSAVMGGDQAAGILNTIRAGSMSQAKMTEAEVEEFTRKKRADFESKSTSYFLTARIYNDGLVLPHEIRRVLGLSLEATLNSQMPEKKTSIFRM